MSDTPQDQKPIQPSQEAVAAADAISSATKNKMVFALSQEAGETLEKSGYAAATGPLMYALEQATGSAGPRKAPALAFTENPAPSDNYLGLYKAKRRLIPDEVLKQIRVTDHLVAAILRARGSMMSLFGHLRKDRLDIGVELQIKPDFFKILTPEQYEKVVARMKRFEQILLNCGHTEGVENQDRITLADFMSIQSQNGLTFGRFATEVIYDREGLPDADGNYPFFRFRPIDAATIVRAVRKGEYVGNNLRVTAMRALESLTGEKFNLDPKLLEEDRYAWLQVIDGTPRQAFTHDEMLVFDLFPSTDIEHNGYPVSPIDTVFKSISTHISIDIYKEKYFLNGRASKGMLVIKSDEVDQQTLDNMKLQFNASINSVANSFRTPIFGVGSTDDVQWLSMVGEGARDADFQFMYDQVARNILSAFSISPDELPGYGHLSKGTNSQTLSESNNEFKLTAARDTGLRPLILKFQTFLNQRLFPIIDPLLAKICEIKLSGIDAQSKEQESARLEKDMAIHMTYDDVLHEVDKDRIGQTFGGQFPFNERFQLVLDKYMDVGKILGHFFGDPSAFVDPLNKYRRDPFYIQYLQLLSQVNPAAVKAVFAPKPYALEFLKMNIQDELDGEDNV
jgi:hypothetical protein